MKLHRSTTTRTSIMMSLVCILLSTVQTASFQPAQQQRTGQPSYRSIHSTLSLQSPNNSDKNEEASSLPSRRQLLWTSAATTASLLVVGAPQSSSANVFLDPAMYGDQELRVSAVDTVRESVRRSILQDPTLAPAFYQLALIDALSYNAQTQQYGPDGWSVFAAAASKSDTCFLKPAAQVVLETTARMKQKNAVTVADAVAIAGAQAIESIGGPVLSVQLGRTDHTGPLPVNTPLDLLTGNQSIENVAAAFRQAGMTDREMTALIAGLMTLTAVEKNRSAEDWKQSVRPKFREAGKMGRMSEFRKLTDEDIADMELAAESDDPDDGWYIADSFGSRQDRFGTRLAKDDINESNFNKYLQQLNANRKDAPSELGWTAELLTDADLSPTTNSLLNKYATANLAFTKDLKVAYNSITQLGAVYTGGKYESLLKNKPRKSLNDDGLNLF